MALSGLACCTRAAGDHPRRYDIRIRDRRLPRRSARADGDGLRHPAGVGWPRDFCELLAAGGRFVISFDNRDCGLSAKLDGSDAHVEEVIRPRRPETSRRPAHSRHTRSSDMADDGFGLLSALGIERAHIVGTSMGGMIAQTMAIEHPERVLTLTSMMSTTGSPSSDSRHPPHWRRCSHPPPPTASYIASADSWIFGIRSGTRPRRDASDRRRELRPLQLPAGTSRQLAAMIESGPRAEGLAQLKRADIGDPRARRTLIAPSGGERTAALVRDARCC